ncbi:M20/M25/M40 family metallo-hydrolase [Robiginitalea marina]|uniref:M20/M25/M40 family metallo-hydrolase n=1 Tax=Robiginitalea marina TaxID=2954105 RepID=A0ABT1B0S1_9FLAO|nr:M20/M25/M40 family metallo-hydrolase [Robiginitalea marina]MCO5725183.1 M20/M25/M40 family metallo-hydrolase [Robiginitalea marina]
MGIALLALVLGSCGALKSSGTGSDRPGPEAVAGKPAESDSSRISTMMHFLASDELQGRDTGSEGIERAAAYLEAKMREFGISPYFQTYRDTLSNSKEVAYNIVGVLEGSDPELKDEYLVIGAHYDHIGLLPPKDGDAIANGANDNASGTSTVLELARILSGQGAPRRSLIFAFFSAEERGLLGSRHLARVLKERGIDLYAMLNFEMTGVPMSGRDYLVYLTGFERSNLAGICNAYGGADLVGFLETAREYNLFQRSDNYAFFEEFNVPSHTFSTFDFQNYAYYHQAGDEASRMDFVHMAALVNRMAPVIRSIADAGEREIKGN